MTADLRPGSTRFTVAPTACNATERFMRERGAHGWEAVVVWIGQVTGDGEAEVERAYVPEQVPLVHEDGIGVYIDGDAITRLILALEDNERVLARLHSHPTFAFHSETDDLNRLISHEGAISIVVPYFARQGLRLESCSVNELLPNQGWVELALDEALRRFTVR